MSSEAVLTLQQVQIEVGEHLVAGGAPECDPANASTAGCWDLIQDEKGNRIKAGKGTCQRGSYLGFLLPMETQLQQGVLLAS